MAGILDTARFRTFLAQELNVSVDSVSAWVLGGHGDSMVPVVGSTTVGGTPIANLLTADRVDEIVKRTQDGGAEIVGLLKTGSAYYAPSAAIAQMVEAVLFDKGEILPCTAYLDGGVRHRRHLRRRPRQARRQRHRGHHRIQPDPRRGPPPSIAPQTQSES